MKFYVLLFFISTFVSYSKGQFDPHWWTNRSGIVHLFSWKFGDIADECEKFLAPHGYAGVQVSPTQEYVITPGRPWWERYQPVSYKFVSRSGNEKDFLDMTKRCNKVGIRIYVDIIINHMAADHGRGWLTGVGGSRANPQTLEFPEVPYSWEDFNQPQCDIDPCWCDKVSIRNCNLVGLTDLNVTRENVRRSLIGFMDRFIELGAAGFRVDTAKHMWPSDLENIYPKVRNLNPEFGFSQGARPFFTQEVIDLGGEVISKFEYHHLGTVTEFKFQDEIGRAFRGANELKYLRSFGETWSHFLPSDRALTFVDNHDSQRGGNENVLTFKKPRLYKMATAFHLSWPYGIPRLMSSFAFENHDNGPPMDANENIVSPIFFPDNTCGNGWICEHRWRQMYNMIAFRNEVKGTFVENWWDNWSNQIAFSRGSRGFIAFNGQYGVDLRAWLQTGMPDGIYCDIISGSLINNSCTGKNVTVYADGKAEILIPNDAEDGVLAFHMGSRVRM